MQKKKEEESKEIECRDCGKKFRVPQDSHRILCDECKIKAQKNHFKTIIYQKVLCHYENCNNVIDVIPKKGSKSLPYVRGDKVCEECKAKNKEKRIEREVRCRKCGSLIRTDLLHDTYQLRPVIYEGLCLACQEEKERNRKSKGPQVPKRKKLIQKVVCPRCGDILYTKGPGYFEKEIREGCLCDKCRVERKEELRKSYSERMKSSNPMKKKEIREKVSKTIQEGLLQGKLKYKRGSQHHLYKGNGIVRTVCKSRLYPVWIKPILERDGFKCTRCGSNRELQVHHLKPFREILEEAMTELNIPYEQRLTPIKEWNEKELEKLLQKVIKKHKIDYGITLCKKCHEEIDYYYRPFKGKEKNKNEN